MVNWKFGLKVVYEYIFFDVASVIDGISRKITLEEQEGADVQWEAFLIQSFMATFVEYVLN